MSSKLLGIVFESDIPRPEKFILLALADHSKDNGSDCYPSLRRLSWKTGYCERQVQDLIRDLEKRGVLKLLHRGGSGPGDHSKYRIVVDNLIPLPPLEFPDDEEGCENFTHNEEKGCRKASKRVQKSVKKGAETAVEYKNINLKEYIVAAQSEEQAFQLIPDDSPRKFFLHPDIPLDAWLGFEEMRKKMRKPMTDGARMLLQRRIIGYIKQGFSARELLETATVRCWLDVYPPQKVVYSSNGNGSVQQQSSGTPDAYALEMQRRAAKRAIIEREQ